MDKTKDNAVGGYQEGIIRGCTEVYIPTSSRKGRKTSCSLPRAL